MSVRPCICRYCKILYPVRYCSSSILRLKGYVSLDGEKSAAQTIQDQSRSENKAPILVLLQV